MLSRSNEIKKKLQKRGARIKKGLSEHFFKKTQFVTSIARGGRRRIHADGLGRGGVSLTFSKGKNKRIQGTMGGGVKVALGL